MDYLDVILDFWSSLYVEVIGHRYRTKMLLFDKDTVDCLESVRKVGKSSCGALYEKCRR